MPEPNNAPYIIAAYVVTWVALIGYAIRLIVTTRRAAARFGATHTGSRRVS